MEPAGKTFSDIDRSSNASGDWDTAIRLDALLAANADIARHKAMFRDTAEAAEALQMNRPISAQRAYSILGLLIGALCPFAIFLKIALDGKGGSPTEIWIYFLFAFANLVTALTGFTTGILIGQIMSAIRSLRWHAFILSAIGIGLLWGAVAGIAGGIFIFLVGGIVGGVIGAMTAGIALPAFAVPHRVLSNGPSVELKHFLPLAFGVVLTICAFILGI